MGSVPGQNRLTPIERVKHLRNNDAALLVAAAGGNESEVKTLLMSGADANAKDGRGSTALHYACEKGHAAVVQALLLRGGKLDLMGDNGCTALHLAACSDSLETVKYLVKSGASLASQDKKGRTPLHLAAMNGQVSNARYLVRQGASVDARDKDGSTPLICVGAKGSATTAKLLLDYGASLEATDNAGRTALCWAARKGHHNTVETLLRRKANIDTTDAEGKTPLMCAAAGGHASIFRLLFAKGAIMKIMAVDCEGATALHMAAGQGYDEVVDLILKAGGRVDAGDSSRRTALSWAAEMGRDHTVQLLLQRGADVRSVDTRGFQPLHWAAYLGRDGAAAALLDSGAEAAAGDHYGDTPLHFAAGSGRDSTLRLLLDRGASVDVTNRRGGTPLHWATDKGRYGAVTALIKAGADLGASYHSSGWTALHSAAACGVADMVKLLLKNGADVYATTVNGETAADIATTGDIRSLLKTWMGTATSSPTSLHLLSQQAGFPVTAALDPRVHDARGWLWRARNHIRSMERTAEHCINVAVIDTGVDLDNQDILQHVRRVRFLRGKAEANKDRDGHGTLVVKLLLSLTPDVVVYVYKVAESRDSLDLDRDQISELAEVIVGAARNVDSAPTGSDKNGEGTQATNRGIDILSLSFGFPDSDEPKLEPLREALRHIHTINHVLILAASCNDGGNTGVMWPASQRDCVICINSSDASGNASKFNPTQPSPRFCTLGEGLELRLTQGQMATAAEQTKSPVPRTRVESGTSFATPIAAALVATILTFVETNEEVEKLSEKEKQRLKRLRTQHGMLQVLMERCVERSGVMRNDYYYIAPWFFSLEPKNIHLILDTLGKT